MMGKNKYIESPERLWELFLEFVEHEKSHPLTRRDYVGKDGVEKDTPLAVPITFEGFEVYLSMRNIINDLGDYSKNRGGAYEDYSPIITRIRNYCFSNNFKGAAVNLFNSNLIAKKLGLIDKQQHTINHEQPLIDDV